MALISTLVGRGSLTRLFLWHNPPPLAPAPLPELFFPGQGEGDVGKLMFFAFKDYLCLQTKESFTFLSCQLSKSLCLEYIGFYF